MLFELFIFREADYSAVAGEFGLDDSGRGTCGQD